VAVGDEEVEKLETRYDDEGFGDRYPKLRAIDREEIAELEPKVVEGRDPTPGCWRSRRPTATSSTTDGPPSRSSTRPPTWRESTFTPEQK